MELMEQTKWIGSKEKLLEGLTPQKRALTDVLMENTRKYIMETASTGATSVGAVADFQNRMAIPMLRRIIPATIGTDLVGVQPLQGPVGLIYSMRLVYADSVDATGTANDITAGDEVFANNSKMKRFYSSANAGTVGYPPALTATTSTGGRAATADYEAFGGRSLRATWLKQTVTTGVRKMQARWTPEAAHDLAVQHNLNMESEMTAALAATIAQEIDNEIITDLLGLAGGVATYDFAAPPSGFSPAFIGDRFAELGILINKAAQEIHAKTRRDPGNFIVCSHLVAAVLQSGSKSVYAPVIRGDFDSAGGNQLIGTLNGRIKVYSYNWGINDDWLVNGSGGYSATNAQGEDILIGYKGPNQTDAGYFYCPYVPVQATGVITDGQTFTPAISLSTRYGTAQFTQTNTSLGNSADYYYRINVRNVAYS